MEFPLSIRVLIIINRDWNFLFLTFLRFSFKINKASHYRLKNSNWKTRWLFLLFCYGKASHYIYHTQITRSVNEGQGNYNWWTSRLALKQQRLFIQFVLSFDYIGNYVCIFITLYVPHSNYKVCKWSPRPRQLQLMNV